ncbi:MAG: hypothetical protein ABSH08_08235 [Tepidisphaeraceae bacterium]|jgi:hypothetical protein
MVNKRLNQLRKMLRDQRYVRFSHRFEKFPVRGYVLDIGPKFFLLAMVSDRIWFDGFECFRMKDISDLKLDPYTAFVEAALKKRGERVPKKPPVNLRDIKDLVLSAGLVFPLVTIQRERVDRNVCWIGRVLGVERGRVSLLEITPGATWDEKPTEYRLSEITRVGFGADYENALHLVGGNPPRI